MDWGQYNFANLSLRGRGVARDRCRALALYRLAAEQGHAKSINMVGRFIEEGWEMPANPAAAVHWYRRAAQAGDFRAQYNLASALALRGDVGAAETWLHRVLDGATAEFLTLMGRRLAGSAEPRLRRLGAMATARGAG
jgi:TPR repeat protein